MGENNEVTVFQPDGPTVVFIAGKHNAKLTWKQRLERAGNRFRKKWVMKSLRANAHTMEQVADYIVNELGYREIDKSDSKYREEYKQMRASFLLQYQPQLLGTLSEVPQLKEHDEESIKLFLKQSDERQKAAENIPTDLFDIDLHIYEKKDKNMESSITIEKKYAYIGGDASGSKRGMKRYHALFRKIYRYYGVTQRDIDEHTKRYEDVVRTLAVR